MKYLIEAPKLVNKNNWGVRVANQDGQYLCTIQFNKSKPREEVTYLAMCMVHGLNKDIE